MIRALATAVLSALIVAAAAPASAQDEGLAGSSFITPFPENDVYQVEVVGDWLAEGLLGGLLQAFATGSPVQFQRKRYDLPGVMRQRSSDDLAALETAFNNDPSHIAIVMLGADDRYSVSRRRSPDGNDPWRTEFATRVDRIMKTLKRHNRAVYWVGLPNMRGWQDNERAQAMNDVIRERAYLNGVRYIDTYANFVDESGEYSDYGPDVTGKIRRLRDTDGVHFTDVGYLKLAHFVERDLRRDLAEAAKARAIPLAGDTSEQARVNPDRARLKAEDAHTQPGQQPKQAGAGVTAPAASGAGDQKADPGKVDVKIIGQGGAEEIVTVDIVRPAIPASVVALVTRKQSSEQPSQMGDVLVDQIPGGLTVMSSIVPPRGADASRRRMSPTQTPYFRVLEKGERLTPKPGRADDVSWPRPQATAEVTTSEPEPVQPTPPAKQGKRRASE